MPINQTPVVTPPSQSRREFVKVFAQIGAYFGLCAPVSRFFVGEVQAQMSGLTGVFNVSLSVAPFTVLQNLNGSVRVEVPNGAGISALVAGNNSVPSIIITRVATSGTSQFGALAQRCSHEGFAVNSKTASSPNLICSSGHGGSYNPRTGAVVTTPPPAPLTAYQTTFTAAPAPGVLQIQIPGIGYTFVANEVTATQGKRLRLMFPTRTGANYEVRFRSAVNGTQTVLPFFTTENGTAPQNSISGSGAVRTVFVNAPAQAGFYVIAARE